MGSAQSSVLNETSNDAECAATYGPNIRSDDDADNWTPITSDDNALEEEGTHRDFD
jgi:hypothetical protein